MFLEVTDLIETGKIASLRHFAEEMVLDCDPDFRTVADRRDEMESEEAALIRSRHELAKLRSLDRNALATEFAPVLASRRKHADRAVASATAALQRLIEMRTLMESWQVPEALKPIGEMMSGALAFAIRDATNNIEQLALVDDDAEAWRVSQIAHFAELEAAAKRSISQHDAILRRQEAWQNAIRVAFPTEPPSPVTR